MNDNIKQELPQILESVLFCAGKILTEQQLLNIFLENERPSLAQLRTALHELQQKYMGSGVELKLLASGYQFQSNLNYSGWVAKLWEEKPAKYSRALLETLAIIAYRQPVTRGDIENIRGVSIATSIFKILHEDRDWIRIVGHKDVPGRPALYATTKKFLDYFSLTSLEQLPSLPEIMSLEESVINKQLELPIQDEVEFEHQEPEPESLSSNISNPELNEECVSN